MTRLLQDPDLRRCLLVLLPLSAAACCVGFWLSAASGCLVLAVCVVFAAAVGWLLKRRLTRMRELNEQIDLALHGNDALNLAMCQEGELSLLHSQLQKVTVRLREQAAQTQRDKEFLSDSIADISHQLRTPLTSLNLVGAMLAETRDEDQRQQLLRQLDRLLQRIDWLVEALLKLSKIDAGAANFRREPVDAAQILRQAAQPLAIAMEVRELRLTITGTGTYTGDAAWSVEAFANILKNCMEHTPQNGRIDVEITQTAVYTQVVIRDSGRGFAPRDLPHLFERFYKGEDAAVNSVGIGLALTQRIVKAQNGMIKAQNHPGGGAMFTVRFYHSVV